MSKPTKRTEPSSETETPDTQAAAQTPATEPSTPSRKREPVEQIAARLGTPAHLLAATRVHAGWAPGREVTETQFQKALEEATGSVMQ